MDPSFALVQAIPTLDATLATLLALAALVGISAFVSGSEVALIGFSRLRRRHLAEEGHPRIEAFERLMERPERVLITILVVNTVANVAAAVVVTLFAANALNGYVLPIAAGTATFLLLTFGEVIPKAAAAANPERWALAAAPTLLLLQKLLHPLVWAYDRLIQATLRTNARNGVFRSEEEIKTLITLGAEEGVLQGKEEAMLHSVIEFGETTAREIMVPRIDVTAVPGDATLDHIKSFVLDSGYSRVPVYQGTVDNVIGILYVKDMLLHYVDKKAGNVHVRDLMREPYYVPESKKLDTLLAEMREKRVHMAIVIDEFGGTAGLVTLEDVIEEVVGDIFDEYDLRTDPIRKLDPLTAVVDARTHVADVNHALDLTIPEDESYDTVAGYIYEQLGRLGKEGEVVHGAGFDVVVEKVTNRRILRVRIVKHPSNRTPEEEGESVAP